MIRHLIPRFDFGPWGGGALTFDDCQREDQVNGGCMVVQWLGMLFKIGGGRVR